SIEEVRVNYARVQVSPRIKVRNDHLMEDENKQWNAYMDTLIETLRKLKTKSSPTAELHQEAQTSESKERIELQVYHTDEVQAAIAKQYTIKFEKATDENDYDNVISAED